jgi:hypothetical protein
MVVPLMITLTPAGQISASGNDGNCNPGEFCIYRNDSRNGPIADWSGDDTSHHDEPMDDCMRTTICLMKAGNEGNSAWNRTGVKVCVYGGKNWAGDNTLLNPGQIINKFPGGEHSIGRNQNSSHNVNSQSCGGD